MDDKFPRRKIETILEVMTVELSSLRFHLERHKDWVDAQKVDDKALVAYRAKAIIRSEEYLRRTVEILQEKLKMGREAQR